MVRSRNGYQGNINYAKKVALQGMTQQKPNGISEFQLPIHVKGVTCCERLDRHD